jgi:hypothetical protein
VAWRLVVIVCGFGQIDLTHICSAESMEPMFGLVFSCILDSSSKGLDAPCFLKHTSVGFGFSMIMGHLRTYCYIALEAGLIQQSPYG